MLKISFGVRLGIYKFSEEISSFQVFLLILIICNTAYWIMSFFLVKMNIIIPTFLIVIIRILHFYLFLVFIIINIIIIFIKFRIKIIILLLFITIIIVYIIIYIFWPLLWQVIAIWFCHCKYGKKPNITIILIHYL